MINFQTDTEFNQYNNLIKERIELVYLRQGEMGCIIAVSFLPISIRPSSYFLPTLLNIFILNKTPYSDCTVYSHQEATAADHDLSVVDE